VQEQDARPPGLLEAGIQQVHGDAVDVVHEAGAYPHWEGGRPVSHRAILHDLPSLSKLVRRPTLDD
jgi:hypothetical protein